MVSSLDKVRTRKRAIEHMITVAGSRAAGKPIRRLAVIHGEAKAEADSLLEQAVDTLQPEAHFMSYVTPVLGVHTGPGALGVIVEWE